ncbi:MAG: HEAT repeat domain-containing protein [Acidimicrobiia bacterium]|nr:HEAT repeat domain-containing protein [Acidimicrobiia bacterium]NNL70655.1 hypothetical protein [Acidimicrobiia bacterium]
MGASREILGQLVNGDPRPHLADREPAVRRLAVVALASSDGEDVAELLTGLAADDDDVHVRAAAIEALGSLGAIGYETVVAALADDEGVVAEAAATALGEIGNRAATPVLGVVAAGSQPPIVREAAIAALGAIGDPAALPTLLDIVRTGKPQLRRRAVVALTAFDGPEVESAFTAARLDRNPMVREAAEMVLGRSGPEPVDPG